MHRPHETAEILVDYLLQHVQGYWEYKSMNMGRSKQPKCLIKVEVALFSYVPAPRVVR